MTQQPTRNTVTYRTVNGLDLEFDYFLPDKVEGKEDKLGVVVWFHGGGLIQGTRKNLYPHLASAAQKHNLCFISADYRLAPQTRFPSILSDLTALFSFILSSKFDELTAGRVDPKRLVTIGNSAGGWLSLLVGLRIGFEESGEKYEERLKDCIRGVVGIYPITSVEHKFWHEKQRPVSYMDRVIEADELKEYLDPNSKEVNGNEGGDRNKMYNYMIQEAILQNLLLDGTDVDPAAYTVAKAIRSKKTVSPLPQIYLIHGTADDKVPHSQTVEVVDELKALGHDSVVYDEREGKDHSFDASEEEEMSDLWKWIVERLQE